MREFAIGEEADLLRFRGDATEIAFALRSRALIRVEDTNGSIVGYQIFIGPKRAPITFYRNGDLKYSGPIPGVLERATITGLDHLKGTAQFVGTNQGIAASIEIRSNNPPY